MKSTSKRLKARLEQLRAKAEAAGVLKVGKLFLVLRPDEDIPDVEGRSKAYLIVSPDDWPQHGDPEPVEVEEPTPVCVDEPAAQRVEETRQDESDNVNSCSQIPTEEVQEDEPEIEDALDSDPDRSGIHIGEDEVTDDHSDGRYGDQQRYQTIESPEEVEHDPWDSDRGWRPVRDLGDFHR